MKSKLRDNQTTELQRRMISVYTTNEAPLSEIFKMNIPNHFEKDTFYQRVLMKTEEIDVEIQIDRSDFRSLTQTTST